MTNDPQEQYTVKQYIVSSSQEHLDALGEKLAAYTPHRFSFLPCYAVTVRTREQEQSLLEHLATMPHVTYREALTRHALDETKRREGDKEVS